MHSRPNVLLITVDHWPGHLLGALGHPVIQTSTLDALAADGILYRNAYSPSPTCVPTRKSIHTGLTPKSHGDRVMNFDRPIPDVPTLAETFRNAGYQTSAVGKMHVAAPARRRFGFEELLLNDEYRTCKGERDDYELFLGDWGHPGEEVTHGMGNNDYTWRSWHMEERFHPTNWATREMARQIIRRDPTRPAFWYLSYNMPHPPLVPPQCYLDLYREEEIDDAIIGHWAEDPALLPQSLAIHSSVLPWQNKPAQLRKIRRAFYALCTQIDLQLRLVLGTLREQGLLSNTVILFTSDHGDMLGDHLLWRKRVMYEGSANVPFLLVQPTHSGTPRGIIDDRLVGSEDIMPTLLDLAGIPIPEHVEGRSVVNAPPRPFYYSEDNEDIAATRMIRTDRYKLIYYADGNRRQLFDLQTDREERHDLAADPTHAPVLEELTTRLLSQLHGSDLEWLQDSQLKGLPASGPIQVQRRSLQGQRGFRWPPLP